MSHVDNVILTWGYEYDDDAHFEAINAWTYESCGQTFKRLNDDPSFYGGSKHLEATVLVAALNGFPEDDFLTFLGTLPWENHREVQYIVKRQHDDIFEALRPLDRGPYADYPSGEPL
jgi:hypothetical protein